MQKQRSGEHSPARTMVRSNSSESKLSTDTDLTENNLSFDEVKKQKKQVHFDCTVKVVLIPDRSEFIEHDLIQELWWTSRDYKTFKSELSQSVREYMLEIACSDAKTAYKLYLKANDQ
jgi:hypothetical protein